MPAEHDEDILRPVWIGLGMESDDDRHEPSASSAGPEAAPAAAEAAPDDNDSETSSEYKYDEETGDHHYRLCSGIWAIKDHLLSPEELAEAKKEMTDEIAEARKRRQQQRDRASASNSNAETNSASAGASSHVETAAERDVRHYLETRELQRALWREVMRRQQEEEDERRRKEQEDERARAWKRIRGEQ